MRATNRARRSGSDGLNREDHDAELAGQGPLGDLVALWGANDTADLWRTLILHSGHVERQHWEALALFRRHHRAGGAPGALTTAMLLCTDRRWRRCTAGLIDGIGDASILTDCELDELAGRFLWSDDVRLELPASWFGPDLVEIDLKSDGDAPTPSFVPVDPDTRVTASRRIPPPLRRWAARHLLRADPDAYGAMLARTSALAARDASAVVSGMLDAVEALDDDLAREVLEVGLDWPLGSVRRLALALLAVSDREGAVQRAARDPDMKVRSWTPDPPELALGLRMQVGQLQAAAGGGAGPAGEQITLFGE